MFHRIPFYLSISHSPFTSSSIHPSAEALAITSSISLRTHKKRSSLKSQICLMFRYLSSALAEHTRRFAV